MRPLPIRKLCQLYLVLLENSLLGSFIVNDKLNLANLFPPQNFQILNFLLVLRF